MNIKSVLLSVFKTFAFALVLSILAPSVVKLTHVFTHYTHEICNADDDHQTHFHKSNLDCDFYKFKLSYQYYFSLHAPEQLYNTSNFKLLYSKYKLVYNRIHFEKTLRGPPMV